MRKSLVIVLLILIVLFAFNVSAAQTTTRPSKIYDIAVNLINQEPDPAEPGKYVDIRFKFDNNGTAEARDVEVEILPEYPFSLDPGREAVKNIGTIQSRQRGDVGVIIKYRLRIDINAIEGENELKLRYRVDKGAWIEPEEFMIDIQTHDAILSVDSVSINKNRLEPGSSGIVKIKLSNEADSLLKDVKVKLDLGGIPFVPLGSTNEKSVYQINAKQSYEVSFELLAEPEADSGIYKAGINITYLDELGKAYSKNSIIGLVIGAEPDLSLTLDRTDVFQAGESGEVTVKVVNKGVSNIKFMNIKILPTNDYRILSTNEVYIGNIDSDDFETADFNVFVEKTAQNKISLPLSIEYMDANNNIFAEDIQLSLPLYSSSEAKKLGLKKGNHFVGITIAVIVVVVGLFFFRKYYKKRKKD